VGKINPKKAINDFSGYADKKASKQKIIHDVFKKGDCVFNSGDNNSMIYLHDVVEIIIMK